MIKVWEKTEFKFKGFADKNPFTDYEIFGEFCNENETKIVSGFYDGDGTYCIRFMPSFEGEYEYRIYGSFSDKEYTGKFTVEKADSHGMVRVDGTSFKYCDGTPYYSIGTTCYAWVGQDRELQAQTIETLKNSAFNKIRFCIFPKHYDYNYRDPIMFPYEGTPVDSSDIGKYNFEDYGAESLGNNWDFYRFNTEYFRMIDDNVEKLMKLGIEADIILFHPYDRWGFSKMSSEENALYLKYITARYGAYRNVWWSMANEYDIRPYKTIDDWDWCAELVTANDPYNHLISIHNCFKVYDFSKKWVTHCSIQRMAGDLELDFIPSWIEKWNKPVVIDEMCYEGNIEQHWGSISGEEMLRRMWKTYILGAHPGHSECYFGDNIWWSHGGKLYGESYKRFGFLHKIMTECGNLHQLEYMTSENEDKTMRIQYFGEHCPAFVTLRLGEERYHVEVIDTWNMTIEDKGSFTGNVRIELPQREYIALRLTK